MPKSKKPIAKVTESTETVAKGLEDLSVKDDVKDLDLLSYCTRALGEWQFIDPVQGFLLSIEKDVALNPEVNVGSYMPSSPSVQREWIQGAKALNLKGTRIRMADLTECEAPTRGGSRKTMLMSTDDVSDIRKHIFFKTFTDELTLKDNWRKKLMPKEIPIDEKVELYWRLRLRNRSSSIVLGILESLQGLKKKGWKNWILPTGDKVPIDSLQLATFNILTNEALTFIDCEKYFQTGGMIINKVVCPSVVHEPGLTLRKRILHSGFMPSKGFQFPHHVLTTTLKDGSRYVIDPCARVYGYKGENGRVVVAAKFEDYLKKEFPSFGGFPVEVPSDYKEAYWLGNGPQCHIERLSANLLKYFDRTFCNYCGIIGGNHPENFESGCCRVVHEVIKVKNCEKCKKVAYCGKLCKDLDEVHSAACK